MINRAIKDSKYAIALGLADYASTVRLKEDIETATNKASDRIAAFIYSKPVRKPSFLNISGIRESLIVKTFCFCNGKRIA